MASLDVNAELAAAAALVPNVPIDGGGSDADLAAALAASVGAPDTDADLAAALAASLAVTDPPAAEGGAGGAATDASAASDPSADGADGAASAGTVQDAGQPAFVQGSFEYIPEGALGCRPVQMHHYGPTDEAARREARIVFILHGSKRDAVRYMNGWKGVAERHNLLLVAPEFTKALYWGRNDYQMGNVFTYESDYTVMNPEDAWSFNLIEPMFDRSKETLGNASDQYMLWGHSAGGQFVHRFLMFVHNHRCSRAISANVGIWTVPDPTIRYPFGLGNTPAADAPMDYFALDHTILIGNDDNTLEGFNGQFLNGEEAHKQGSNRVERTDHFAAACCTAAEDHQVPYNWKIVHVNNMSHQSEKAAAVSERVWFLGGADGVLDAENP